MAIEDTVWGRLTRFNPPRQEREYRHRPPLLVMIRALRWIVMLAVLAAVATLAAWEMRTSQLQAMVFPRLVQDLTFTVEPGQSERIKFPTGGPYDERLGYVALPEFIASLTRNRYAIDSQARWSPALARFVDTGVFPVYLEKDRAGLRIFNRAGEQLYGTLFPEPAYQDFAHIPDLVVRSLLFIEDRYLLDPEPPQRNPAIEWNRFGLAAATRVAGALVPDIDNAGGGSTLATQIEKFRHSPRGLTGNAGEKLRQMLTASVRGYYNGPDTRERREQIVTTYLNSTPLASMAGFGEIIGLPQALWIWFGTDHEEASKILKETPRTPEALARKGEIYRQVLSLLLSGRRPSYYLHSDREGLAELTDRYLRALSNAGVIDPALRDAALAAELNYRSAPPPATATSYVEHKAIEETRNRLVGLLRLPDLYALDRLDLTVETSIDTDTQARVATVMQRLSDPAFLRSAGMTGRNMLGGGDPSKVTWSFVLYERGMERNHVRVHADTLNQPFDINSGAKLQLGSTAKLRTLATYLQVIAELHERLSPLPARELSRLAVSADDPLTSWAASYLARKSEGGLQPMLDAAMQRRYSAGPDRFFTGGGTQSFSNFAATDNSNNPTVAIAFEHSVNLPFVRLMRDIARYYTAANGVQVSQLLGNRDNPDREAYLQRFVDADSRRFLYRFYRDYRDLSTEEALALLVRRTQPAPRRLAAVYLSLYPHARIAHFQSFLMAYLPRWNITKDELWDSYLSNSPERLSLADRGYVAGIHPLEIWMARYLKDNPGASWQQVVEASAEVRQDVYGWLFQGNTHRQDLRIRILLEQDAFNRIYEDWRAVGFPFGHLVPSLGTSIGASGDRPDALAELVGIILNDGVRSPTASIERLRFATDTPYETNFSPSGEPERVMPVEVARTLHRALTGVVTNGTARRIEGAYTTPSGTPLVIGGKTGTGDNRRHRFGRGGNLISSQVVDRTASFVFFIGDRFFGTVTAYVDGEDAARFSFTSGITVQLLKLLEPELRPLINGPVPGQQAMVGSSQRP
jgi:membrane peptidoglycan carboxypeptidase